MRTPTLAWLSCVLLVLCAAVNPPRPLDATATHGPSLRPQGTPRVAGMFVLSGSLHDHSTDSDGHATPDAVVSWEYAHRRELGLDFATLSDHSDFFPFAYQHPEEGNLWIHQALVGERFTRDGFSVVRGFEYTSDQENHVSVLGSTNYLNGRHQDELSMATFYRWLATPAERDWFRRGNARGGSDGIAQFDHPSMKGALQWDGLKFVPAVAANLATIEIFGDQGATRKNLAHSDAGWYWLALARGWTVGPVMDWDTHDWQPKFARERPGASCGRIPLELPCQRTLILASARTPHALLAALRARRTTATQHPGFWATLRGPDGAWQGSTVAVRGPFAAIALRVDAGSSVAPLTRVDIIADANVDPHAYYDGDSLRTLPGAANGSHGDEADEESEELSHAGPVAASYALQHRWYLASRGHAVRKAQIDGPPPSTLVASATLHGYRSHASIVVAVPERSGLRPDGKHFFYAIVHAGPYRAWTSPIFTTRAPAELAATFPRHP
jgi:hypothetical protein